MLKKSKCKGKTKKGKNCSKSAYFYLCNSHWKNLIKKYWKKIIWFLGILTFIASVVLLPQAFQYVKDYIFPKKFIKSQTDNTIRGIILDDPETNGMETLSLAFGMSNTSTFLRHIPFNHQRNTNLCMLDPFDERCNFQYRIDSEYRLFISAKLYDINNKIVGIIKDNEFVLNLNNQFSWNMNDKAFEVLDSYGLVLFTLKYTQPNILNLQVVINNFNDKYLIIGVDGKSIMRSVIREKENGIIDTHEKLEYDIMEVQKTLKPYFRYHGNDYFGELSTD
jgi:hypothetical protein